MEGEQLLSQLQSLVDSPDEPTSTLSTKQIQEIAVACVKSLTKHGCITTKLIEFLNETYTPLSKVPTSATPDDRPDLMSCDKAPSSTPATNALLSQNYTAL